jgi:hypothetical protein
MYTTEFHNELYGHIQEKEEKFRQDEIEDFFLTKGHTKKMTWIRLKNGSPERGFPTGRTALQCRVL